MCFIQVEVYPWIDFYQLLVILDKYAILSIYLSIRGNWFRPQMYSLHFAFLLKHAKISWNSSFFSTTTRLPNNKVGFLSS
jgi:hypothetical protein